MITINIIFAACLLLEMFYLITAVFFLTKMIVTMREILKILTEMIKRIGDKLEIA